VHTNLHFQFYYYYYYYYYMFWPQDLAIFRDLRTS